MRSLFVSGCDSAFLAKHFKRSVEKIKATCRGFMLGTIEFRRWPGHGYENTRWTKRDDFILRYMAARGRKPIDVRWLLCRSTTSIRDRWTLIK